VSQDWTSNVYTTSTVVDTTMSNIELMFETLRTTFSGTSTPSSPVLGQQWYDTTKHLVKFYAYNGGSNTWYGFLAGSSNLKIWIYANSAIEGWARDSSVTDVILSLKGGSTYVTGGDASQGSWTISGLSSSGGGHVHQWYKYGGSSAADKTYDSGGSEVAISKSAKNPLGMLASGDTEGKLNFDSYTTSVSHTHTVSHTAGWRPLAATGILIYPDI